MSLFKNLFKKSAPEPPKKSFGDLIAEDDKADHGPEDRSWITVQDRNGKSYTIPEEDKPAFDEMNKAGDFDSLTN